MAARFPALFLSNIDIRYQEKNTTLLFEDDIHFAPSSPQAQVLEENIAKGTTDPRVEFILPK